MDKERLADTIYMGEWKDASELAQLLINAGYILKPQGVRLPVDEKCECVGSVQFSGGYGIPKTCLSCNKVIDDCVKLNS